jgi:hypothetical protein
MLGVHIQTAVNWASRIRRDWTTYIADRVSAPHQGIQHDLNKCSPPVLQALLQPMQNSDFVRDF